MIEYARCIYNSWAEGKSTEYIQRNTAEFLCICSRLLSYTPKEVHERLINEQWYCNDTPAMHHMDNKASH